MKKIVCSLFLILLVSNAANAALEMDDLKEPRKVMAKIRYAHKGEVCLLERVDENRIKCTFENPVRAITPGQAVVFYEQDYVLGGGTIIE